MRSIKIALLFLIAFSVFSDCKLNRNVVFLHGIAGSGKTSGQLDKFLKRELSTNDECVQTKKFIYDTGSNKKDINVFISEFDAFLKDNYANDDGEIHLLTHSQGGLIALMWMINIYNSDDLIAKRILHRIENMVTLSTPFWGAQIANMATAVGAYILPFWGKYEVRDMSYGSETMYKIFRFLSDANNQKSLKSIRDTLGVNFFSFGGVFPHMHWLKKYLNLRMFEGDLAVGPFSSNMNFIWYRDDQETTVKDMVEAEDFQLLNFAPFKSVTASHFALNLIGIPGIQYITKSCLKKGQRCKHPTAWKMVEIIKNGTFTDTDNGHHNTAFRVNAFINHPDLPRFKNVKISIVDKSDKVRLFNRSMTRLKRGKTPTHTRFTLKGSVAYDHLHSQQHSILLKISAKGMKTRFIRVKVMASTSSLFELDLDKQ